MRQIVVRGSARAYRTGIACLRSMDTPVRTVRLEVFSDYTCPWCYVGWARLENALQRLPRGVSVAIEWRPFEIHPEVPLEGMPVEDLPYTPDVWARMQEALRLSAAEEGLDVGMRPKVSNTHRALAAGAYAQSEEPDVFPAFHERLFKGYFAQGGDLGDPTVVDRLADEAGIDTERMVRALNEGRFEAALTDASQDARLMGISGTPTFVFDRRIATSGAQPTDVLLRAFESALESDQEE
jgi:predicted DsbA family dithiol-disulfide isomerase